MMKLCKNCMAMCTRLELWYTRLLPWLPGTHVQPATHGQNFSKNHCCQSESFKKTLTDVRRGLHTSPVHGRKWHSDQLNNPMDEIQKYVDIPIIEPNDMVFKPSPEQVESVQHIFKPTNSIKVSTMKIDKTLGVKVLPPAKLPEICMIGRSNVGKSSLIKALFHNPVMKDVKIRVSKTPGRTRTLLWYDIPRYLSLIDMPGYGHNMPDTFIQEVENYIQSRSSLQRTFLLIDSVVGITARDQIAINMMEQFAKPYVIILTKIDKCGERKLLDSVVTFNHFRQEHTHCCLPQPFLVSAHQGAGLALLRAFIAHLCGHLSVDWRP